ncbi:hypothetical protein EB796_023571 [Bugula neritina]|uniref:Uncharacterized protein n=1 Tax=Bugula neritina TaxID=10212 RepID=A0A7J7IW19_BUGNE|nr:hypothetical protein EB796_023571 [Bugula neritina]
MSKLIKLSKPIESEIDKYITLYQQPLHPVQLPLMTGHGCTNLKQGFQDCKSFPPTKNFTYTDPAVLSRIIFSLWCYFPIRDPYDLFD